MLLQERHIDGPGEHGGELRRRADFGLRGRDGTGGRIRAKRAGGKRRIHCVQVLAAENVEVELGKAPAASGVQAELVFLRLEDRLFDEAVVVERDRQRIL